MDGSQGSEARSAKEAIVSHLRLVAPEREWQKWPRGYEPTDAQLEDMTEEEYDAWSYYEYGRRERSANHPTMRPPANNCP